ncbi:hypothetical protein [Paracoccus actinidiae]|uniref:hypothetical protein n=1 Tax=Paracoccus actinidiae TaxID=3064531 RepID=UPI0027D33493|nr:hypothetical protein [Paracoccus sp. M09]
MIHPPKQEDNRQCFLGIPPRFTLLSKRFKPLFQLLAEFEDQHRLCGLSQVLQFRGKLQLVIRNDHDHLGI